MFIRSLLVFAVTGVTAILLSTGAAQAQSFEAKDQSPSGKFTAATEVKQILDMTKAPWITVRLYEGRDLLYFTNLLSWRSGTHEIRYAVSSGAMQVLTTEPCYETDGALNALNMDGRILPYVAYPENSVVTIEVQVLYDDLTEGGEKYERAAVQIG